MAQLMVTPMKILCGHAGQIAAGMSRRISPRSCASEKICARIRRREVAALHQFFPDGRAGGVSRENRAQQSGALVGLAYGISH